MPLTAAYELCVVNWKSLHMLLTNKLKTFQFGEQAYVIIA